MNYWDISEEFLKIPPCLDQMHVQVAEIGKKMAVLFLFYILNFYISLIL